MADTSPLIYAGPIVGGLVLYAIIHAGVRAPGRALAVKFKNAGDLKGRTKEEIITAVGSKPSSVSAQPEGKTLLQWQVSGYHIALRFGADGRCEGITHEFLAK